MILAGDIGGTHTRLAFFEGDPAHVQPALVEIYPSHAHRGLDEIVRAFLSQHPVSVEFACFGIAGPVRDGRAETPNLPWVVDARQLAGALGFRSVALINDLEANAYGIALLKPEDFVTLNEGAAVADGNQALISAGTGLGEAGLVPGPSGYRPFPSEGGHCDFAPRDDLQIDLLRYLQARFGHVSYERVLSGPGLRNVYEFLRDTHRAGESPAVAEEMSRGDAAAVVSRHGLAGTCELCVRALDLFVSVYGAEAGNLALKVMAVAGVFVGGGIAPRIIGKLREPAFLQSFVAKGRLGKVLETIPVRVIMNDRTALLGAGRAALAAARR